MHDIETYYSVLGLSEGATVEEVRRAYAGALRSAKLSRNQHTVERVKTAYNMLRDEQGKRNYDEKDLPRMRQVRQEQLEEERRRQQEAAENRRRVAEEWERQAQEERERAAAAFVDAVESANETGKQAEQAPRQSLYWILAVVGLLGVAFIINVANSPGPPDNEIPIPTVQGTADAGEGTPVPTVENTADGSKNILDEQLNSENVASWTLQEVQGRIIKMKDLCPEYDRSGWPSEAAKSTFKVLVDRRTGIYSDVAEAYQEWLDAFQSQDEAALMNLYDASAVIIRSDGSRTKRTQYVSEYKERWAEPNYRFASIGVESPYAVEDGAKAKVIAQHRFWGDVIEDGKTYRKNYEVEKQYWFSFVDGNWLIVQEKTKITKKHRELIETPVPDDSGNALANVEG